MVELFWRRKIAENEPDVHCIRNLEKSGTTQRNKLGINWC